MLNLTTLRTPGVYIDEIPKFPPSIAAVDTAIPVFIGYTAETVFKGKDYLNKPQLIESLVDFEQYFGGAPTLNVVSVDLDQNNAVTNTDIQAAYYLYDCLRLYFRNGGGKCYIITIGKYPGAFNGAAYTVSVSNALTELEKADEPTLILFPDGILLDVNSLGSLHVQALAQCQKYKDRFLMADVKIADTTIDRIDMADITAFKTAIGMSDLEFGAAYYPYLQVDLPRTIRYRDIRNKVRKLGSQVVWTSADFAAPTDLQTPLLFQDFDNAVASAIFLEGQLAAFLTAKATNDLQTGYLTRKQVFINAVTAAAIAGYTVPTTDALKDAYTQLVDYLFAIVHDFMDQLAKAGSGLVGQLLIDYQLSLVNNVLPDVIIPLVNVDLLAEANTSPVLKEIRILGGRTWDFVNAPAPTWQQAFTAPPAAVPAGYVFQAIAGGDAAALKREKTVRNLTELVNKSADSLFAGIASVVNKLFTDASQLELTREQAIIRQIPVLGNVLSILSSEKFLLPPSSAVAGVYVRVDANRGVWKAPANESLRNVVKPLVRLTEDQHGVLNVDPSLGKSINAIRYFTGKGSLVFSARTLAGNSNEWRYINVRRFFNMVEESSKNASGPFVFEPNDANTWIKVQAMIENFLTSLWRQGALQGATTDQAFYVAVGLGKTMTALDILEGRMIVEIGMAVVRPAEFIILRFSHKLPEA